MSTPRAQLVSLPVARVHRKPDQPRKYFDPEALRLLAESIDHDGQAVPAIVRPHPTRKGHFQLVAGERRWRAISQHCTRVSSIVAIVVDADDSQTLRRSFVENENRRDLHPLEKAHAMRALMDDGLSAKDIARMVGKTDVYVYQVLSLLKLRPAVQEMLSPEIPEAKRLALSAAIAIARLPEDEQLKAAYFALQPGTRAVDVIEKVADSLAASGEVKSNRGRGRRDHLPRFERRMKALQRIVDDRFSHKSDIRSIFFWQGHVAPERIEEVRRHAQQLARDLDTFVEILDDLTQSQPTERQSALTN